VPNTDLISLGKNIIFSAKKNTLTSKSDSSQVVPLENLEAKVLLKLYQAQGETLSKSDLFKCWPVEITTSDNSLTRIISNLRKKSKSIDPSIAPFIVNISKKGYHLKKVDLTSEDNIVKDEHDPQEIAPQKILLTPDKSAELINDKTLSMKVGLSILFITMTIVLGFISVILFSSKSISELDVRTQTTKPHYRIAYEAATMKYELSPSKNGDTILFSAQELNSPDWLIAVHTVADSSTKYIKRQGVELTSPIWLTRNTIALKNIKDGQCWIEKITLSALLVGEIGETITTCSAHSATFSMTYNGKDSLFITESYKESIPANLRLINISNGEQKTIKNGGKGGAGIYKVVTNRDNSLVALLSNNDWFTTHIAIYKNNNFHQPIWYTRVELPLYSVALFTSKIKYRDTYGGITTVYFDDDGKATNSFQMPLMQSFKAVSRFNNGVIFNEGEFYSQNLFMHGLYSNISTAITDEKGIKNNIPYPFDHEHIWYASNRTGISQIWSYNQNTTQHKQVSDFKNSLSIKSMSIDKSNNIAAIATQNGILIFSLNEQYRFGQLLAQVEGTHPTLTTDTLIFTGKKAGNYNLFSYQLSSGDTRQITTNGGYNPIINAGKLFFENYHKFGLWTLSEQGREELLIPLTFKLTKWFYFEDSFYLYNKNNQLYIYNTVSDELIESEMSMGCNRAIYINNNYCIKVQNEKFANQMVILDEQL